MHLSKEGAIISGRLRLLDDEKQPPIDIKQVRLTDKDFDGVYFKENAESIIDFMFVKFHEEEKLGFQYNEDLGSYMHLILLWETDLEGAASLVYFQAILGDPMRFVKNQIAAGSQGIVIKQCNRAYEILEALIKSMPKSVVLAKIKRDRMAFSVTNPVAVIPTPQEVAIT